MATTKAKPKPAAKPERRAVLEINTLAPVRPFTTVDDVRHEFRLTQEFSATEHQQFTRDLELYNELWDKRPLEGEEQSTYLELLDALFDRVLVDAPALRDQVGERLTGAIQREILLTFTNAPLLMAWAQMETEEETENPSTGATSRRA